MEKVPILQMETDKMICLMINLSDSLIEKNRKTGFEPIEMEGYPVCRWLQNKQRH
jgi:hypothetical protein